MLIELGDVVVGVEVVLDVMEFDFCDLEIIEEWLFVLCVLVCKYDVLVDDLVGLVDDLCGCLGCFDVGVGDLVWLIDVVVVVDVVYDRDVVILIDWCVMVVKWLDVVMVVEFVLLKMECVVFIIELIVVEFGLDGCDVVVFIVVINLGVFVGVLDCIVLGGEFSWFLLVLKVCLV